MTAEIFVSLKKMRGLSSIHPHPPYVTYNISPDRNTPQRLENGKASPYLMITYPVPLGRCSSMYLTAKLASCLNGEPSYRESGTRERQRDPHPRITTTHSTKCECPNRVAATRRVGTIRHSTSRNTKHKCVEHLPILSTLVLLQIHASQFSYSHQPFPVQRQAQLSSVRSLAFTLSVSLAWYLRRSGR